MKDSGLQSGPLGLDELFNELTNETDEENSDLNQVTCIFVLPFSASQLLNPAVIIIIIILIVVIVIKSSSGASSGFEVTDWPPLSSSYFCSRIFCVVVSWHPRRQLSFATSSEL